MTVKTVGRVAVPGAALYYEVTGSGPVLLIAGGGADASAFDGIVPQLAAQYTVVAYDPRGNSRSRYDVSRSTSASTSPPRMRWPSSTRSPATNRRTCSAAVPARSPRWICWSATPTGSAC